MTSTTPTPHDAIFKGLLGKPEHARGVLRATVPPAVAEAIDWQTLTSVPTNFVALELGQQYTDLLFSAKWHDGSELLAYFLFEHQSAPPKLKDGPMAFRLLRYQVRIWEDWLSRNPDAPTLPVIIPVVMYHGHTAWTAPRWFGDVLAVPPEVRPAVGPYLVQFEYLLTDISEISDDKLRAHAFTAVVKLLALCFKYARTSSDFLSILGRWMDVVGEVATAPNGLSALAQLLCYVLQVNKHVQREQLQELLTRDIGPQAQEAIVTAGQLLIEQGRQQGLEQGRQQGFQELLLQLLRQRFGDQVNSVVERRVMEAPLEQVQAWTKRLLSAATLGELFES
jgi:predicted transposase/invertase (TIGR01784 family)